MSVEEQNELIEVAVEFNAEMLKKILAKERAGYQGWENPQMAEYLRRQLVEHTEKGDYVDVANIAMFLWHLEQQGE